MANTQGEIGGKDILLLISNHTAGTAVTFQDTGDTVTLNAHGFFDGDTVQFATIVTTTGISVDTDYYVVGATANTFQVAATVGGAALTLTNNGTGTLGDAYQIMGGLRSKSFALNSEAIDVTNHDSSEWRKILDLAGIRSVSASGSGVFQNGYMINVARARLMANQNSNLRLVINPDGDYFQGSFKFTSMEYAGEYNAESSYSLSLESAGVVTFNEGT